MRDRVYLNLCVHGSGNLVDLLVKGRMHELGDMDVQDKERTLEKVGCRLRYRRRDAMHLSAESMVSNLNGEAGMIQLHYKEDHDSSAYSQYKSVAALAIPHVASKGPNTLDLPKRRSESVELVFRKMRRKTIDINVGGL
jgi:hypothetical protein